MLRAFLGLLFFVFIILPMWPAHSYEIVLDGKVRPWISTMLDAKNPGSMQASCPADQPNLVEFDMGIQVCSMTLCSQPASCSTNKRGHEHCFYLAPATACSRCLPQKEARCMNDDELDELRNK